MTDTLDSDQVRSLPADLTGWNLAEDRKAIEKTFKFKDFSEAFGFMTRAALAAEQRGHHPDWSNVYNVVHVRLSTHDAGGLTEQDFDLARAMDRFA